VVRGISSLSPRPQFPSPGTVKPKVTPWTRHWYIYIIHGRIFRTTIVMGGDNFAIFICWTPEWVYIGLNVSIVSICFHIIGKQGADTRVLNYRNNSILHRHYTLRSVIGETLSLFPREKFRLYWCRKLARPASKTESKIFVFHLWF